MAAAGAELLAAAPPPVLSVLSVLLPAGVGVSGVADGTVLSPAPAGPTPGGGPSWEWCIPINSFHDLSRMVSKVCSSGWFQEASHAPRSVFTTPR